MVQPDVQGPGAKSQLGRMEELAKGDDAIRGTLTTEGAGVYSRAVETMKKGSPAVAESARENAYIYARMAERWTQYRHEYGDTAYAAEDFEKAHPIVIGGEGRGLGQPLRDENKIPIQNPQGDINWGYVNEEIKFEDGTTFPVGPIQVPIGYQLGNSGGIGYTHAKVRHEEQLKRMGYPSLSDAIMDTIHNADFINYEKTRKGNNRLIVCKENEGTGN